MTKNVENEISMKQYLLGELTEPEQQVLEERLMTSNDYLEELLVAEDELVDEYVRGVLSAREEERFKDHFLCTPDRHHKLRFSGALQKHVAAYRRPTVWGWPAFLTLHPLPHWILKRSLAAALLLMVLGGSWLTFRIHRLEQVLEQVRSQQTVPSGQSQDWQQQLAQVREHDGQLAIALQREQEQRGKLEHQLASLKTSIPQRSPLSVATFALIPGVVRGDVGGLQKVTIPDCAKWVQLELDLAGDDYQKYRAVLQREGNEIYALNTPKITIGNDTEAVVLTLPAQLLPYGDYTLNLSGIDASSHLEAMETYTFKVPQK